MYTKLCDMHLSPCEKPAQKIISDPSYPLSNDRSKCYSHTRTPGHQDTFFLLLHTILSEYIQKLEFSLLSPNSHQLGIDCD